jgi:hypothetical protein
MIGKPSSIRRIDLDGPEGNAFYLLGIAEKNFRQMKTNPKPYLDEMKGGDYFTLVKTFDKYFGTIYRLETTDSRLIKKIKSA